MIFQGTATALITPFTNDSIDTHSLERIIDNQIESGIDAIVVLGTTGEPATMTTDEKQSAIRTAVRVAKGKIPIIVGAGSNSTQGAISSSKMAQDLGADALLVVTPYYNKCTQDGLVEHYGAIAKSTSLNIICYNVPSRTGVNMLPSTFEKLATIKNIVGVKEASGNMEQISHYAAVCEKCGKALYCGDDALTIPAMSVGASGVISVASNVIPQYIASMTHAMLKGDLARAKKMQLALLPLVSALFCEVNPIPIKAAMSMRGWCKNILRLPLTTMSSANAERLKCVLDKFDQTEKHTSKTHLHGR